MSHAFKGAATVRAALLMTGSTYITYALTLVISILVARAIGPEDFGRYSYLVWLSGSLTMIANNGLTTTGIRFISECLGRGVEHSARRVHGWLWRLQWGCMLAVALIFVVLVPHFVPSGWSDSLGLLAALVMVSMVTKGLYLFGISMAKGYGNFAIEPTVTVVMGITNLVLTAMLILFGASLIQYLWLFAFVSTGHVILSSILMKRAGLNPVFGDFEDAIRSRVRQHLAWTVILTAVSVLSNKSIETWLLNSLVGPAEVGYFAIAAALTRGGIDLLSSGLTTVLMPVMAHAYGESGKRGVNSILSNSFRYFQFLGLLLAGSGFLVAPALVDLAYGPRYHPVANVLEVMVVIGGVVLSEGAFGAVLSTTDNQRLRAGFALFSVTASAVFAFVLIPRYGLSGAILAHASSRLLAFLALLISVSRYMTLRLPLRELSRLVLAAIIAAGPSFGMRLLLDSWWVGILAATIYAVLFVSGTILFGAWKANDAVQLAGLLSRFPRTFGRMQSSVDRWAMRLREKGE